VASSTFAALPAAVKPTLAGRRPKLQLTYEKAIHVLIDATPGLNRRTCDLLHKLAHGADGELICELAQETIARRIRCSVDTVARGQREAIDRQLLKVKNQRDPRTGHHRRSKYRLLVRFVDRGVGTLPVAYWEHDKVVPLTTGERDGDLKASPESTDPQPADPPSRTMRHSRGSSIVGKEISVTSPPAPAFSRERAERDTGGAVSKAYERPSGVPLVNPDRHPERNASAVGKSVSMVSASAVVDPLTAATRVVHELDGNPPQVPAFTRKELARLLAAGVHRDRLGEFAQDFVKRQGPFAGLFGLRAAVDKTVAALRSPFSQNAAFCSRYAKAPPSREERVRRKAERQYIEQRLAIVDNDEAQRASDAAAARDPDSRTPGRDLQRVNPPAWLLAARSKVPPRGDMSGLRSTASRAGHSDDKCRHRDSHPGSPRAE